MSWLLHFQWQCVSLLVVEALALSQPPLLSTLCVCLCVCVCVCVRTLSLVWLFAIPRTEAHQLPLSMGFCTQESWSRLPFPPPGDLSDQRLNLGLLHWQVESLPLPPAGKPFTFFLHPSNTVVIHLKIKSWKKLLPVEACWILWIFFLSFLPNCFLSCRKPCPWLSMELSCITTKLENCIPLLIMMQYIRQPCSSILPLWCFPPRDLCPLSRLAAQPVLRTSGHHHPGNSHCLSPLLDAPFPLSQVIISHWWGTSSRNFLKKNRREICWDLAYLKISCLPSSLMNIIDL